MTDMAATPATPGRTVPDDIRSRLDADQLERLEQLIDRTSSAHAVDYRVSSALFGRRFYVALLAGADERAPGRTASEGHRRSILGLLFELTVFCLAVSTLLVGSAVVLVFGFRALLEAAT